MRSAVVLPDPDGPTRTMSSPSSTWRSSAWTAGVSEPVYSFVAWRKRTSAIGSRSRLECCDRDVELPSNALLRLDPGAELVQAEERGADDRRRLRVAHGDRVADFAEAGLDRRFE